MYTEHSAQIAAFEAAVAALAQKNKSPEIPRPEIKPEPSAWDEVRGFEKLTLSDWPGHQSCIIFLGGCEFRCPTCHNYALAWTPQKLPVYPRTEIKAYLSARAKWLDGIVITGGEPTENPRLAELLTELRTYGLPIKVDTNASRPDVVRSLLEGGLADAFSVDVKGPYRKYPELTGNVMGEDQARENLNRIFRMAEANPGRFLFRTTQVPILSDADVDEARGYLPEGASHTTQKFVPPRRTHA